MPGVFQFEYQLPVLPPNVTGGPGSTSSASVKSLNPPLTLELENDLPSILQFPVGINDVGGSLVVELGINNGRVSQSRSRSSLFTSFVKTCRCLGAEISPGFVGPWTRGERRKSVRD